MRLCGYSDWRLPTKDELLGLVVKGGRPTIDSAWFPNTQANWYWTSSPDPDGSGNAWYFDFGNGYAGNYNRDDLSYLRLVR